ncbi:MAG: DUF4097 family beta strand repeat protein [Eubacterium sp.]|nr:DUF4097 family beta strand repeat protein [Eubacterium sp.]
MPKGAIKYIVGGSMVTLGIMFMVVAFCIGGPSVLSNGLHLNFINNDIYIDWNGIHAGDGNYTDSEDSIMDEDIKNLKVDFDYGEMIIKTGDVDRVKIETTNVIQDRFKYEVNGDTLTVKYDRGWQISFIGGFWPDTKITITLPRDMVFENADIQNGAGKMTVDGITAEKLSIKNGAGEMIMNNVIANNKLDIDGGVGAISVRDAVCGGIDADIGVGQLTFTGEVNGDGKIDSGIGAVYMTLYGDRDDYDFKTDNGIGQVTTPGANSGGKYTFRVSSGIGEVRITMQQKEA